LLKQFSGALSQKEKSIKELYTLITEHGPISKSHLIKFTGMKQTTCTRLIDELLESELIVEKGYGESSGGRKPVMYEIKQDANYVIGIDIARTNTRVLLMDLGFNILDEAELPMNEASTPEVTLDFIISSCNRMIHNLGITHDDVLGAGIGTVGPLDRENGMILNPIYFQSKGWENLSICSKLSDKLQLKTFLDYGTNTALLAEYQQESFNKYKNVVHVLKGVGTRTGIIVDGRLVRGSDKLSMFGQGHMVVDLNGKECICGKRGCVHAYSSLSAIKQEIISNIESGSHSIILDWKSNIQDIQFDDIFRAVHEKDPLVIQVVKDAAYYTGIGLSNLINVLFPDLVILSGPTYSTIDLFYDVVTETAAELCKNMYSDQSIVFSRGQLGKNATAIGAGRMVVDHYLSKI
jgi:predicted NBD/HSP70 family sugar kinase